MRTKTTMATPDPEPTPEPEARIEEPKPVETLADAYPKQQARIAELLTQYEEIGKPGEFGAMMLRDLIKRSQQAAAEGDIVGMIRIYDEMLQSK